MELKLVTNTARSAVLELTESENFIQNRSMIYMSMTKNIWKVIRL